MLDTFYQTNKSEIEQLEKDIEQGKITASKALQKIVK